jgi:hypothetical protein
MDQAKLARMQASVRIGEFEPDFTKLRWSFGAVLRCMEMSFANTSD